MSEKRRAEDEGAEVEEEEEEEERRVREGAPDRQAGGAAGEAQSGAGGPGSRSEPAPLSSWLSSVEITHNMNYV